MTSPSSSTPELEPRMTSDEVRAVASDGEVLYIGTPEGLYRARYRYDRASESLEVLSWRSYNRAHGLASSAITDIELDNRGSIWVGTEGGLTQLDGSGRLAGHAHDRRTASWWTTGCWPCASTRPAAISGSAPGTGLGRLRVAAGGGELDEGVQDLPQPLRLRRDRRG